MMQTANDWKLDDFAHLRRLHRTLLRCVLAERASQPVQPGPPNVTGPLVPTSESIDAYESILHQP